MDDFEQAAEILDGGGVAVIPTDTVYGLAARPGALTLVIGAEGFRIPDHDRTRRHLAACGGVPSTVVRVRDDGSLEVLRQGAIQV